MGSSGVPCTVRGCREQSTVGDNCVHYPVVYSRWSCSRVGGSGVYWAAVVYSGREWCTVDVKGVQ